jgi:hypothetical protein
MLKIKKNHGVKLKLPEFQVDNKLSPHLDEIPLLSHLNKSFACSFIGRAGSGKTSLMTGLLQTKNKFKKVFHKIYLFMPSYSRGSMKKCIFDCLPDEQVYHQLTLENLAEVYTQLEENSDNKLLSLIIFDDVQDAFRGECKDLLLKIINNRRHLRTSIMIIAQSYKKMSPDVRKALTNHFLFNLSKQDYQTIYEERIYYPKSIWENILEEYRKDNDKKGNFLFIDPEKQKPFIGWDEVIIEE